MKKFNSTKELIRSNGYWVLNKKLVKVLGLETAFLLSSFADAEDMLSDDDGWFYQTTDTVENLTTLSRHKQDQCIKQLEDLDILKKDTRGLPPKRYFKIDYDRVTNLFVNNLHIDLLEIDKSICKKSATSKELSNKELKVHKEIHKDMVGKGKKESIPYKEVVEYFNKVTNRDYKLKTKSTRDLIKKRWNEGFTLNDFFLVIDYKFEEWNGNTKMEEYIRPKTFFSGNMDDYLNKAKTKGAVNENNKGYESVLEAKD